MNRRSFFKASTALSLSALLPRVDGSIGDNPDPVDSVPSADQDNSIGGCPNGIFLVLHGPWFLHYANSGGKISLEIATADVMDHDYKIGSIRSEEQYDISPQDDNTEFPPDFFKNLQGGDAALNFPHEILCISLVPNDLGHFDRKNAKVSFILPPPKDICALRLRRAGDFKKITEKTPLRDSIANKLGTQWGRVTALRYSGSFPGRFSKFPICHLYAELKTSIEDELEGVNHLNMALKNSMLFFTTTKRPELRVPKYPPKVTVNCPKPEQCGACTFQAQDQMSLFELFQNVPPNKPSCPLNLTPADTKATANRKPQINTPILFDEFPTCANFGQFAVV